MVILLLSLWGFIHVLKHLRAGTALQWMPACRARHCRNPTMLKESLQDCKNSNKSLLPDVNTNTGWLEHALQLTWRAGLTAEEVCAVPLKMCKLAIAVTQVMSHISLLQQPLSSSKVMLPGTCRLAKPHCLRSSLIICRPLDWQKLSSISPFGLTTATVAVNTFYHSLLMQTIFFFLLLPFSFFFFPYVFITRLQTPS